MREVGPARDRPTVTNGVGTSLLWKKIHASVRRVPLRTLVGHPGASLGAAVAAAVGSDVLGSWADMSRFVQEGEAIQPDASLVARYDDAFAIWSELSESTTATARAIARL